MFHNFIPNSLRIEAYSNSVRWPWCVPSKYLFFSSTGSLPHNVCAVAKSLQTLSCRRDFLLFFSSRMFFHYKLHTVLPYLLWVPYQILLCWWWWYLLKLPPSTVWTLIHLCLSSYCSDFFLSIAFFADLHPTTNTTISIYCCFLWTWTHIPLELGLCVLLLPAESPAAQIAPDIKDVLSDWIDRQMNSSNSQ